MSRRGYYLGGHTIIRPWQRPSPDQAKNEAAKRLLESPIVGTRVPGENLSLGRMRIAQAEFKRKKAEAIEARRLRIKRRLRRK